MNFANRIKLRAGISAFYLAVGAVIIAAANFTKSDNEAAYCFGAAFAVCGAVRMVRYIRLLKTPDVLKQMEIAENDEMNITLAQKARSAAFLIYFVLAGLLAAGFYIMGNSAAGEAIAYVICAMTLIYWICYRIIRRKYC